MLLHVFPRHSVQATEHSRPCFLQLQRFESQFVLHLQYIVFRSSSRAGGKLDLIGMHISPIFCFHIVSLTDPLFHLMKHSQNMKVSSVWRRKQKRCHQLSRNNSSACNFTVVWSSAGYVIVSNSDYHPKVVSSNPFHCEVYSIQHYVMQFVTDLRLDTIT